MPIQNLNLTMRRMRHPLAAPENPLPLGMWLKRCDMERRSGNNATWLEEIERPMQPLVGWLVGR